MASNAFRLAIIGAGGIAAAHAAAVKDSGGRLVITAVIDPVAANREKLAGEFGAAAFPSHAEFFAANKKSKIADGVLIATPPSIRIDIVAAALKHGVPVLSEKPLAHTLADAKKLAALSRKFKKTPAFVGYCHRFSPAILEMKAQLASGKLGRLTRFENFFACDLPGHEKKWFSDPKVAGGGALLDMGSHSFDLLHFMVGPSDISGASLDHKWKGRTETGGVVLTRAKKKGVNIPVGATGVIISGWAETSRFTVALLGDQGMLAYDYEKPEELVHKDLLGKATITPIKTCGVRFLEQLLAFADAVSKKKNPASKNLATFEDAFAAAEMDAKARKKAK